MKNVPSTESKVTIAELSKLFNVNEHTVRRAVKALYPTLIVNGLTTLLGETEVTNIKSYILDNKRLNNLDFKVGVKTKLEEEQIVLNAFEILTNRIKELTPKAEKFDHFLSGENSMSMQDVAKSLGTGRNRLFNLLRMLKYLMDDNLPYQKYIESGLFEVIEVPIRKGMEIINKATTRVTAKGMDKISELVKEWESVDEEVVNG